jgi:rhodanese-related sulfurtransferase
VTSVGEEKRFNPRLGGDLSEGDFAGYMNNLGLPHPKQIDVAVPANLRCGKPKDGEAPAEDPDWAPLTFTFAGIWEVQPRWVEEHLDDVAVVDVREPDEYAGPMGHIRGSTLVPLGELAEKAESLPGDKPIVTVCRAGGRSAQATQILRKAGFDRVANLAGGMLRWRAAEIPVEGGSD